MRSSTEATFLAKSMSRRCLGTLVGCPDSRGVLSWQSLAEPGTLVTQVPEMISCSRRDPVSLRSPMSWGSWRLMNQVTFAAMDMWQLQDNLQADAYEKWQTAAELQMSTAKMFVFKLFRSSGTAERGD